jgi:flagellar assembly factor FliW
MNCAATLEPEETIAHFDHIIRLPGGLLGFEQVKEYALLADPEEAPFLWLQMLAAPNRAFLVVSPSVVQPGYQADLSDADTAFLDLRAPEDALIFNIVTLRRTAPATVNLKGPIVLNRRTLLGRQVIPLNAADLPLQHPLPLAGAAC